MNHIKIVFHFLMLTSLFFIIGCKSEKPEIPQEELSELEKIYSEKHRPQFHFSPKEKWMNDPNGMVYYEGEYHLFYQYYPDSTVWGPMHWGHAVSTDMLHWEHLPIALYPDELGYIFSGSAVIDWNNTSGFGQDGKPPMIAIFTHHLIEGERAKRKDFQYQSIAYSLDKGRSWTKYSGNPVIPNTEGIKDFRDPKVIWDDASDQWLMVFAAGDHVMFWGSPDLKSWTHLSNWGKEYGAHGGVWECPDIFTMKVENTQETKYVMLSSMNPGAPNGGSGTQYFVGDFDGKNFIIDPIFAKDIKNGNGVWLDYGRDNYAGVTWSDVPETDGRRLFMGWMSNWDYAQEVPTEEWRSAMTLPRTLRLVNKAGAYRLLSDPVKEMDNLRTKSQSIIVEAKQGTQVISWPNNIQLDQSEVAMEFDLNKTTAESFGIRLYNDQSEEYIFKYDAAEKAFYSDRSRSGDLSFSQKFAHSQEMAKRFESGESMKWNLFIDASSIEIFIDDNELVLTEIFFPSVPFNQFEFISSDGVTSLQSFEIGALKSIWP